MRLSVLSTILISLCAASAFATPGPLLTEEQLQANALRQIQMMSIMFDLRHSRLGFEETVAALRSQAEKRGWKLAPVQDVQAAMQQAGAKDAPRVKVIPTCPANADERIARASEGKVPPLPCRITVFVNKEGKTQIVKFNTASFAKAAKGELAKVLGDIANEEDLLLKTVSE